MKYLKYTLTLLIAAIAAVALPAAYNNNSTPQTEPESQTVLRHVVLVKFNDQFTGPAAEDLDKDVYALKESISQIYELEWGVNILGDPDYTYCLLMSFRSEEDLAQYQLHPEHMAFAAKYGPYLEKITEIDYWK